ncbi:MAG: hypothetical protein K8J08_22845 [Thermoanaerobaculia bacterium]|nr:hypothetical protein [Thermoanaerobaculia bacterium]
MTLGSDPTGNFQKAVEDARVRAAATHGTRIEFQLINMFGRAGGPLNLDLVQAQMVSRAYNPSLTEAEGLTRLDEGGEASATRSGESVNVVGYNDSGNWLKAIDSAVKSAADEFPAGTTFGWRAGLFYGESSKSQNIADIFHPILAESSGSSTSEASCPHFMDVAEPAYGSNVVVAVGTSTSGDLQEALERAIVDAKAQLKTDHVIYQMACITGAYGDNGTGFVDRIFMFLYAFPG